MSFMKKKLIIGLSIIGIAAAISSRTTTALLHDETSNQSNVMTLGNVKIAQTEWQRAVDKNGNWISTQVTDQYGFVPDKLEPFDQNKIMLPLVGEFSWDERKTSNGKDHQQSWRQVTDGNGNTAPGSNQLGEQKNAIDKFVFVQNTGETELYFRTVIAVESPERTMVTCEVQCSQEQKGNKVDAIWLNTNGNERYKTSDEFYTEINGVRYYVFTMTHTETLKPGEFARPSLLQAYLKSESTLKTIEGFGEHVEIKVISQAVQASNDWKEKDGKTIAEVALDAAFGEINTNNHPWK
jgi:hypothetical protein